VKEPPAAHVHTCSFVWNTVDSCYSTNFTSYSGKDYEMSTGDEPCDHYHPEEEFVMPWRVRSHVLSGGVQSVVGLPSSAERKYVTVTLFGRKGQPKRKAAPSPEFISGENRKVRLSFDFGEVKTGWELEVAIWKKQLHGDDVQFAAGKMRIRDIELDSSALIQLPLNGLSHRKAPYGKVSLIANHRVAA
jgi:hypothetical protein